MEKFLLDVAEVSIWIDALYINQNNIDERS